VTNGIGTKQNSDQKLIEDALGDDDDEEPPNPIQDIKDTFNLLISRRMLWCMPMIIWSAWSLNFFAAIFIVLSTRTMKKTHATCDETAGAV